MDRISSGNPQIDRILAGGFPVRSINIIMGEPGTGKTLFVEQLSFSNAQEHSGRPVLYTSTLSEPLSKFLSYVQDGGLIDPSIIGAGVQYEDLEPRLSREPQKLVEMLKDLILTYRPRILVIDSFKAIAELIPERAQWRRILADLAGLLSAYDVTTFWVGEYCSDSIGVLPEFAVADGILELSREQRGTRDDRYLHVVKLRGSGFLDGQHTFRIGSSGLEVFPRLLTPAAPSEYKSVSERLSSGIAGLDAMIEAGWLRGTSTLVLGPSGSGKTVIGLSFLREGVRNGEPGFLVSFEENPTQLARMLSSFGWNPAELIGPGRLDVLYTAPVELQIDTIVTELFRRIDASGIRRVVIDGVGELEASARDPVRFREYIYAMTQYFARMNITSMLTLQHDTAPTRAANSYPLSPLSDNTVQLEMAIDQDLSRHLRVIKSRASAHSGQRRVLQITSAGVKVE
jgi:circadian clock protein KaiC